MTHLTTLLTFVVFGLSIGGPTVMHSPAPVAVNDAALPISGAIDLPEVIVTAPKVPADSVDFLMGKYQQTRIPYPLVRSLGGYGVIVVAGIFALVWISFIITGMADWPREPRIPRDKPRVHLHDMFQEQPVAVYDVRKKRLDALRGRR